MRRKRRILDLFCGAGGAAKGYYLAGFEVIGIDKYPQPRYPYAFVQMDAFEALRILLSGGFIVDDHGRCWHLSDFDVIHASPRCQGYSVTRHMPWVKPVEREIDPVRDLLISTGKPYVIENVVGAAVEMDSPFMLCGLMFGLKVFRHRLFESNLFLLTPPHPPHEKREIGIDGFCCVAGHGDAGRNKHIDAYHRRQSTWSVAMGIDWMTKHELTQAIPPAYTRYIGEQLNPYLYQE